MNTAMSTQILQNIVSYITASSRPWISSMACLDDKASYSYLCKQLSSIRKYLNVSTDAFQKFHPPLPISCLSAVGQHDTFEFCWFFKISDFFPKDITLEFIMTQASLSCTLSLVFVKCMGFGSGGVKINLEVKKSSTGDSVLSPFQPLPQRFYCVL